MFYYPDIQGSDSPIRINHHQPPFSLQLVPQNEALYWTFRDSIPGSYVSVPCMLWTWAYSLFATLVVWHLVAARFFEAKFPNPHHHQHNAANEARVHSSPHSSSAILCPTHHFSQGFFFVKIFNTSALVAYQAKWMLPTRIFWRFALPEKFIIRNRPLFQRWWHGSHTILFGRTESCLFLPKLWW